MKRSDNQTFINSKQYNTELLISLSKETIKYVKDTLTLGAGNIAKDITNSGGLSSIMCTKEKEEIYKFGFNYLSYNGWEHSNMVSPIEQAVASINNKSGNCDRQAYVGLSYLASKFESLPNNLEVGIVTISQPFSHYWLELKLEDTVVYCDPWLDMVLEKTLITPSYIAEFLIKRQSENVELIKDNICNTALFPFSWQECCNSTTPEEFLKESEQGLSYNATYLSNHIDEPSKYPITIEKQTYMRFTLNNNNYNKFMQIFNLFNSLNNNQNNKLNNNTLIREIALELFNHKELAEISTHANSKEAISFWVDDIKINYNDLIEDASPVIFNIVKTMDLDLIKWSINEKKINPFPKIQMKNKFLVNPNILFAALDYYEDLSLDVIKYIIEELDAPINRS